MSAALRQVAASPVPEADDGTPGNHEHYRTALAVLARVGTLPPEAQRRLVLMLVARQFGEGVAAALGSSRA